MTPHTQPPQADPERSTPPGTDDPANEEALPPDPPPSSDPEVPPRVPNTRDIPKTAEPETLGNNLKVTPLDEDKHLEDGIEVNET